jgi:hypothetical protein
MVKKTLKVFTVLYALSLLVLNSYAGENLELLKFNGEVSPGVHSVGFSGKKIKVGEYDVMKTEVRPDLKYLFNATWKDIRFNVFGNYFEDNDQSHNLGLDLKRILTSDFIFYRFWHWLDHDPLTNLAGAATKVKGGPANPPYVTFTNNDPLRKYGIAYSEVESKTTFRLPVDLPVALKAFFDYRKEMRDGKMQALTMGGKCSACHVVGHTKKVNESTEDFKVGLIASHATPHASFNLSYDYLYRRYDGGSAPLAYYDRPLHPETGLPVFDDRIQYKNQRLPFAKFPDSSKWAHTIKGSAYLSNYRTGVYGGATISHLKNKDTDLTSNQKVYFLNLSNSLIPRLSVNFHVRWLDIANAAYYVDVIEPISIAGGNKGYTWYQHNASLPYKSFNPDFKRISAMSREELEAGVNLSYLLTKGVSLRGSYTWKQIDRDNDYYTLTGDKEQRHTVKLGLNARYMTPLINRPTTTRISYKYEAISHPFGNPKGAFVGIVTPPTVVFGTPWNATQYWQLQEMRNVALTNRPKRVNDIRFDNTIMLSDRSSLTLFYKYTKEKNDSVGWENWKHEPSITLWYAPNIASLGLPGTLDITLSYMYRRSKTHTLFNLPLYDG